MWKLLEPRSTAARTSGTGRAPVLGRSISAGRTAATRTPGASGRERGAAAAGGGRVRVADDELGAVETFAIVDLGATEVLHAHGIDQQLHALVLDAGVAVLDLLVELEAVLQSRAAAALHEDPQHEVGIAFAADEIAHLASRGVGEQECVWSAHHHTVSLLKTAFSTTPCPGQEAEGPERQVAAAAGVDIGVAPGAGSGLAGISFPHTSAPISISMTP